MQSIQTFADLTPNLLDWLVELVSQHPFDDTTLKIKGKIPEIELEDGCYLTGSSALSLLMTQVPSAIPKFEPADIDLVYLNRPWSIRKEGQVEHVQVPYRNMEENFDSIDLPCCRVAVDNQGNYWTTIQCLVSITRNVAHLPSYMAERNDLHSRFLIYVDEERAERCVGRIFRRMEKYKARGFQYTFVPTGRILGFISRYISASNDKSIICSESPVGTWSELDHVVAIYDVEKPDEYYQELPGLLSRRPDADRRSLHVGPEDRVRIIPVLKRLFDRKIVKTLCLLFDDGRHFYVYNVSNWESFFLRKYENGLPIPLGIHQRRVGYAPKESRAYSLDLKEVKCKKCIIVGPAAFQCEHKTLCKICSDNYKRLGVSRCSDCPVESVSCRNCSGRAESHAVECGHVAFCRTCLDKYQKVDGRICPECLEDAHFELIRPTLPRFVEAPEPAFNEAKTYSSNEEKFEEARNKAKAPSLSETEFEEIRKKTLRDDLRDWGVKSFIDGRCCKCNLAGVESCALECGDALFCRLCLEDYKKSPFDRVCPVCLREGVSYELWDADPPSYLLVPEKDDLADEEEDEMYKEYLEACKRDLEEES